MLDKDHLTLNTKILESDKDEKTFKEYWHEKILGYAEDAKNSKDSLNELDDILAAFYSDHFREEGVEKYFQGKERVIPEMAREIRSNIESELYEKWKQGDVSIVELQKVSKLILEKIDEIRKDLETSSNEEKENYDAIDEERSGNIYDKNHQGMFQKILKGNDLFNRHKMTLEDLYISKTEIVALEFAKKLAAKLFIEMGKMDIDISSFGQKINDAIAETEKLIVAQRKVNKGLEDMKGAIIEVSEDETMETFEVDLKTDKVDMPNIARTIREQILPEGDFYNFGRLAEEISVDEIKDAFDIKLSEIVRIKHDEKADSEKKVLGLNILTQLRQKLKTDDDIKAFATKIIGQSGVYLKLNNDQIQLHLRNNEGNLSPTNPASINKKAILISIPSPDDNSGLKGFADKLEDAFKNSINQSIARTTITVNRKSPRKDELSILTVGYCFPMRAIDWLSSYKVRYEDFLHTGNLATDAGNAILLHSEGDGTQFPPFFAVDNAEEIAAEQAQVFQTIQHPIASGTQQGSVPPPMPNSENHMPPPIIQQPDIKLYMAVAGQQYGPYTYDQCKQLVKGGQLTQQSVVWMDGMSNWAPASQVKELQDLFAPPAIPGMPPIPPITGGQTPPPMI